MSVKAQSSFINSPTALRIKVQRPQHYPWSHYHHFSHLLSLTSAGRSLFTIYPWATLFLNLSLTSWRSSMPFPLPETLLSFALLTDPCWTVTFSRALLIHLHLTRAAAPLRAAGPSTQLYQFTSLCLKPLKMRQATTTTEALKYLRWLYSKFPW